MIPLLPQDRGRLDPKNVPALVVDEKDGCKYQLETILYWSYIVDFTYSVFHKSIPPNILLEISVIIKIESKNL